MLGLLLEGIDLREGPGGAVRREVVAVDSLDHTDETVRVRGASQDGEPGGSDQADSGPAVAAWLPRCLKQPGVGAQVLQEACGPTRSPTG